MAKKDKKGKGTLRVKITPDEAWALSLYRKMREETGYDRDRDLMAVGLGMAVLRRDDREPAKGNPTVTCALLTEPEPPLKRMKISQTQAMLMHSLCSGIAGQAARLKETHPLPEGMRQGGWTDLTDASQEEKDAVRERLESGGPLQ